MGCCYAPGEIVVVPKGPKPQLTDELPRYSAGEWLTRNEVEFRPEVPVPYVKRVPVGREVVSAQDMLNRGDVAAALPNYFVRLSQAPFCGGAAVLNEAVFPRTSPSPSPFPGVVEVLVVDTGCHRSGAADDHLDACDPSDVATDESLVHGSLVCELVRRTAGAAAKITSARALGGAPSLAGVLTALYVSELRCRPEVINLSLSWGSNRCANCGYEDRLQFTEQQLGKAFGSIMVRSDRQSAPVWIAAAGNDSGEVLLPARLPNVIAVGAYDSEHAQVPSYAVYEQVPEDRFVMAFGGTDTEAGCIAKRRDSVTSERIFGTSFAAPQVAGLAARILAWNRNVLRAFRSTPIVLDWLRTVSRPVPDHNNRIHGLGLLPIGSEVDARLHWRRWPPDLSTRDLPIGGNQITARQIEQEAYFLWERAGRPLGQDVVFWNQAKQNLRLQ